MPPNSVNVASDHENQFNTAKPYSSTANLIEKEDDNYNLRIFNNSLNILTHTLIGAVTGITILYAFRNGVPLSATSTHIVLCVIGYQLLMAQAILSLSPHNGWSKNLRFVDKRRAHWILQIVGSGLAIAGSFFMMLQKPVNFNTIHGQFALVALVLTVVCFVNGLASNYTYELRKCIPGNLSKLTHICFGTVAFAAASISLCYGFDKNSFRAWIAPGLTPTVIALTVTFTSIIIVTPLINFAVKLLGIFKN